MGSLESSRGSTMARLDMITIVENEVQKAVEIMLDEKGIELLIKKLGQFKSENDHLHLYATNDDTGVSTRSPYPCDKVFGELILQRLPSEAWEDQE
jgi:pyruvate kinase